ncbi:hypothetical protein CFI10_11130 [Marinobacterium iners]|uniref:hypothetical protein n=1 Tax=Marinobacterium iners TaxID=48076 RepID=UPI001A90C21F|nr:hypothetical protein [Marinobacterium iners]QSR35540.1 hypothetical protein CFI10_11130 [Marinobacterium iners]
MIRTLTAAAIAATLSLTAPMAAASDIRVNGGKDIIRKGDQASKLPRYLGRPDYSEVGRVCRKPSIAECKRDNNTAWGRIYQYYLDDKNYQIEVYDGTITRIHWTR